MEEKKRRRNCADRMRAEAMTRKIHRRKRVDPAMSVLIKMLWLMSFTLNLLPPVLEISLRRRRLPLIPEPPAPPVAPVLFVSRSYKYTPSWNRLVRDLARPVAQAQALEQIRARLPTSLMPWIDYVVESSDWSSLRAFSFTGATDKTVAAGATLAAAQWQDAKDQRAKEIKIEIEGGAKGAGSSDGPGHGNDDDGTTKPKLPK